MKLHFKSLALGFFLACLFPITLLVGLFFYTGHSAPVIRDQPLASGKIVQIASFYLVWGIEHDERNKSLDSFQLDYILSNQALDEAAVDQETLEVFELVRPISEQWGFNRAEVLALTTASHKDKHYIYNFTRDANGKWNFVRSLARINP